MVDIYLLTVGFFTYVRVFLFTVRLGAQVHTTKF